MTFEKYILTKYHNHKFNREDYSEVCALDRWSLSESKTKLNSKLGITLRMTQACELLFAAQLHAQIKLLSSSRFNFVLIV